MYFVIFVRFKWKAKKLRELLNTLVRNDWSVIWVLSINWQKLWYTLVLNRTGLCSMNVFIPIESEFYLHSSNEKDLFLLVNFLLRKIFHANLNETISLVEFDVTFKDWRRTFFPDNDCFMITKPLSFNYPGKFIIKLPLALIIL